MIITKIFGIVGVGAGVLLVNKLECFCCSNERKGLIGDKWDFDGVIWI